MIQFRIGATTTWGLSMLPFGMFRAGKVGATILGINVPVKVYAMPPPTIPSGAVRTC